MTKKKGFFDKVLDFGSQKIEEVVEKYVQEKITNRIIKIGEVSLAFFLGVVCIVVGIAQFIASLLSVLENGLNYILIGIVLLFIAYFLSR